ncbi:MAG TPA: sugar transferase [Bryobacteraceae bacterium]|nr:sugar transferase [Bryobacteraceae bacterium]
MFCLNDVPCVEGDASVARRSAPWRALDAAERVAAAGGLLFLSPFLLTVGVATAVLSRNSPLIAHRRLGAGGNPFWVLKFRTMWSRGARPRWRPGLIEHIEDETGPHEKCARDARISSRFARFCRRHSIDELPQLLHVVRGEMSLVGPRPITASEWRLHYQHASDVLDVKPGLSGLWQIMGRNRLSYEQRRELDLALARNHSLKLYFQILLWTLPEIWNGRNAW